MKLDLLTRALLFAVLLLFKPGAHAASQAPVAAEHGMVVAAHRLATHVGVDILKSGGNAIDAAVAVGYTLAVVYPAAGNLGGGGFMTIQLADGRRTFLDFREKAPLAASMNMYLDSDGNVVAGLSTYGHLAVAVPGTVSGMETALAKYGTKSRSQLLAPAIAYAQEGFVLTQSDVDMLAAATDSFRRDAATAAIFLNKGEAFKVGERLQQPDLAKTLRRISEKGADGFYKGRVGAAIVKSSWDGGGILMQADLDRYQTREFPPIECSYRDYLIISAPPPSSGGATLCEMLNILEGVPLRELGYRSAQAVHYQIEAMRRAFVDRNTYLGDPDFEDNPIDLLLDKGYAAQLRAAISPDKAGVPHDEIFGVDQQEGSNTTHYSIIDRWGNAVSVTYTLNDWFGAKIVAANTGVLLNNEMDDFTIKVGKPNLYGLVQGEANSIEPEKRPLSSMSPTIVVKNDKPVMVLGTPGGSRIITTVLLTILNVIDYDMDIQEAVDAPRFHQQDLPDTTNIERFAIGPDARALLESWGQHFGEPPPANQVAAILVGAPRLDGKPVGTNLYYGAIDPRRQSGLALGY